MILNLDTTPDWYLLEGDFAPPVRLKLKPYTLMTAVGSLPDDYEPGAKLTLAQQGIVAVKNVVAELIDLLEDWEGVELESGEKAPIEAATVTAFVAHTPNVYMPVRKILDEHRIKWGEEGNVSKKPSRGRRKVASTTAKPVARRKRRVRKESLDLTGNGALLSSTNPGR